MLLYAIIIALAVALSQYKSDRKAFKKWLVTILILSVVKFLEYKGTFMRPFFNEKGSAASPSEMPRKNISQAEFGNGAFELCSSLYNQFYSEMRDMPQAKLKLNGRIDEGKFSTEFYILNLWAFSRVLGSDKKALDTMHKKFVHDRKGILHGVKGNMIDNSELGLLVMQRYKEYYGSWNHEDPSKNYEFTEIVFRNLYGLEPQIVLNASPEEWLGITIYVLTIMKSARDLRQDFPPLPA